MVSGILNRLGLGRTNELIGVDIGTASIKICTLKSGKDGFKLGNLAVKTYEEDLLSDGSIINSTFLAEELRAMILEAGIKAGDAACALSSYSVIAKRVAVPFLDEDALENTMSLEVETVIPFPLKDIYYSYYVIGADDERESMMNVQIVAAKREIVDGYMKVFEAAGLKLRFLDVDIFGITNLIEQIYNPREMSVVAVDIGASVTNIAIMKEESVDFTREVLVGGRSLTNRIERAACVSYGEAEEAKLTGGEEAAESSYEFISNISAEINKTINFYISTKPKERIGKIYLTGGSSLLKGLQESIQANTGIEVEYIDPFLYLNEDPTNLSVYEHLKELVPVALYLSSRVKDLDL